MELENYNEYIDLKFNGIKIKVTTCKDNQIKMRDRTKIEYCETPICKDNCPINSSAKCIPQKDYVNNVNTNKCVCLPGYEGEFCKNKIYANLT